MVVYFSHRVTEKVAAEVEKLCGVPASHDFQVFLFNIEPGAKIDKKLRIKLFMLVNTPVRSRPSIDGEVMRIGQQDFKHTKGTWAPNA